MRQLWSENIRNEMNPNSYEETRGINLRNHTKKQSTLQSVRHNDIEKSKPALDAQEESWEMFGRAVICNSENRAPVFCHGCETLKFRIRESTEN